MKRKYILCLVCLLASMAWAQDGENVTLRLVQTSDVHGNYYPYDFIGRRDAAGGLSRVCSYVRQERGTYGDRLVLLDNGDILQGQPAAYYYNYMDTTSVHLCADMMNFMGYDAGNMGNHDVETGRRVFDRWASDCRFPVLGANIVDAATGRPHFRPYVVLRRGGVKVAVLGLTTPAIPAWLPESLWRGLRFDDMEETARHWMQVIRERERPDVVVGIFHSGRQPYLLNGRYRENASVDVARRVPGFDVVLIGHDHARACFKVANEAGDSVLVVNPANNALAVGEVDITLALQDGKVTGKRVEGRLTEVGTLEPDKDFLAHFSAQHDSIQAFVSKKIGRFTQSISTRPAYFGPSAFVDLIHRLQLEIGQAEISLAAPLSFDARIEAGDIRVSDMFNLYKYENMLYTMSLSGREVRGALEMSYALWTRQMQSPDDDLLLLREPSDKQKGAEERSFFRNPSYNFDSAAGIIYTVDVTRPAGQKVTILGMADGTPFDEDRMYRVAVNSYRGNGGGELLTRGAGIPQEELKGRILFSTDKDLRYYLMQYIGQRKVITPQSLEQWRFIPENWVKPAAGRDWRKLFGRD